MAVTDWKLVGSVAIDTRSGSTGSGAWDANTISYLTSKGEGTIGYETEPGQTPYSASHAFHSAMDKNSYTNWLRCTNFGFTTGDVPSGATIDGIEIRFSDCAKDAGPSTQTLDAVRLWSGVEEGTAKSDSTSFGPRSSGTGSALVGDGVEITLGGTSDVWGWTVIDDADVRSTNFGVRFSVASSGTFTGGNVSIDALEIRVYYTSSGSGATVTPTAVVGSTSISSPTVTAQASASITATAVVGTAFIPTHTVTAEASATITATAVTGVTTIDPATLTSDAQPNAPPVIATSVIDSPTVTATSDASVSATAVAGAVVADAPTVTTATSAEITVTAVTGTTSTTSPTVTAGADFTATVVTGVSSITSPTITAGTGASVTATSVTGVTTVPTPTVDAATNASITATAVQAVTSITSPTLTAGADLTGVAVLGTSSITSPVVVGIRRLKPTSDVSVVGWSGNGAATVWQAVADDDAAYAEFGGA